MRWMTVWVRVAVWAAVAVSSGRTFSGASVGVACDSMQPGHLSLGAQTSSPPYGIFITPRNTSYYVTVYGQGNREFKGFLLQARDEKGQRVGRFTKVQKPGRIIECSFDGGAVQHRRGDSKTQVTARWEPQGFKGQMQFRATVVESYTTYWMDVLSEHLSF
ncbi:defense protein l(2)34Fc [Procambarus clarkii]|uniref:defense protein l(2)34Fc n=1 Tax=Procambarus clarkii TaxID=6728 RepID=UPI001E674068|nr:defense protein l(2)34Fc-like [Procambarus clarkii]